MDYNFSVTSHKIFKVTSSIYGLGHYPQAVCVRHHQQSKIMWATNTSASDLIVYVCFHIKNVWEVLRQRANACSTYTPKGTSCICMRYWEVCISIWQHFRLEAQTWLFNSPMTKAKTIIIRDETWITQRWHIVLGSPSLKAHWVLLSLAHTKVVWGRKKSVTIRIDTIREKIKSCLFSNVCALDQSLQKMGTFQKLQNPQTMSSTYQKDNYQSLYMFEYAVAVIHLVH